MSDGKFRTMRHIETVRNYLNMAVVELLRRAERHDQSKLESPEVEFLEHHSKKLRSLTYGSPEYFVCLQEMKIGIESHYQNNSHHPEHFRDGINDMTLFDLIEMLCDWKSASLRHDDGNIYKSLEINRDRYAIGDQLRWILQNTIDFIESQKVDHKAGES